MQQEPLKIRLQKQRKKRFINISNMLHKIKVTLNSTIWYCTVTLYSDTD